MPTPTKGRRLGGSPAHERLMLANMATSLFTHGRITTTQAKAKRLRPLAERLITKAKHAHAADAAYTEATSEADRTDKRGDAKVSPGHLHNRREISRVIRDKDVVHRLLAEIGPFFADRPGGYTRIIKTMPRKGDNAKMAIIELVNEKTVTAEATAARKTTFAKDAKPAAAAEPEAVAETDAETASPAAEADVKAEAEDAKAEDPKDAEAKSEKKDES